jgi:hypothetical protein
MGIYEGDEESKPLVGGSGDGVVYTRATLK